MRGQRLDPFCCDCAAVGTESVGYFAKQPAQRLPVFVHGFGGNALKT